MRPPWKKRHVDPSRPHRFKPGAAPVLGDGSAPAVVASDPTGSWGLPGIIVNASNFAEGDCEVCRRAPDDPIHDVEE
jgi:hypothetical protein